MSDGNLLRGMDKSSNFSMSWVKYLEVASGNQEEPSIFLPCFRQLLLFKSSTAALISISFYLCDSCEHTFYLTPHTDISSWIIQVSHPHARQCVLLMHLRITTAIKPAIPPHLPPPSSSSWDSPCRHHRLHLVRCWLPCACRTCWGSRHSRLEPSACVAYSW